MRSGGEPVSFLEIVARTKRYLEAHNRLSLRSLRREADLDAGGFEALVEELVTVQGAALREGEVLVWVEPRGLRERVPAGPDERRPVAAERRQLTVMFVDLVQSTALAEQTDPEDYAEILESYQATCRRSLAAWGGYIAQPLGDGLVVYFGYPRAQEDAPARAVRAGLEIAGAVGPLSEELQTRHATLSDQPLRVRIGIHTGLAVVGDVAAAGTAEQVAVGETPNLASRLQGIAGPNQVVVSDATLRLVPGLFLTRDLGTVALKGITAPVRVHHVLRGVGTRGRFEVDPSRLTPLVGRKRRSSCCSTAGNERARGTVKP